MNNLKCMLKEHSCIRNSYQYLNVPSHEWHNWKVDNSLSILSGLVVKKSTKTGPTLSCTYKPKRYAPDLRYKGIRTIFKKALHCKVISTDTIFVSVYFQTTLPGRCILANITHLAPLNILLNKCEGFPP